MIAVALDHGLERGLGAAVGGSRKQHPVGDFGPNQQAETVGDIVIAWVLDLDVGTQAVEADALALRAWSSRYSTLGMV